MSVVLVGFVILVSVILVVDCTSISITVPTGSSDLFEFRDLLGISDQRPRVL